MNFFRNPTPPPEIRDLTREQAIAHYRKLQAHLRLVRAEQAGLLNDQGHALLRHANSAAESALRRLGVVTL